MKKTRKKHTAAHWTQKEIKIITANAPKMGNTALLKLLPNRSINAIESYKNRFNLTKKRSRRKGGSEWTAAEIKTLLQYYNILSYKFLQSELLPNRSGGAIRMKACELNLTKKRKDRKLFK